MKLPESKWLAPLQCQEGRTWVLKFEKTVWRPGLWHVPRWGSLQCSAPRPELAGTGWLPLPQEPDPHHGPLGVDPRPLGLAAACLPKSLHQNPPVRVCLCVSDRYVRMTSSSRSVETLHLSPNIPTTTQSSQTFQTATTVKSSKYSVTLSLSQLHTSRHKMILLTANSWLAV